MKKALLTILTTLIIAIPLCTALIPQVSYADDDSKAVSCGVFGSDSSIIECVFVATANISQWIFAMAGWLLTMAGILLNVVLIATLNMKDFVDATPAIGIAWRTIRDFSSVFIIFMLLYASIKMILGLSDHGLGNLIKNIVIAGLLINFSLFMTKAVIDTSNIVSLQFYQAMVPAGSLDIETPGAVSRAYLSGGLSNVFMQSLDIQTIAGKKSFENGTPNLQITQAYIGGTVLEVVAAFSFLFAAIAFGLRIGILILLMAFSPIYFIAMIIPDAKKYAEDWKKTLFAMCLFMPVYLFLMYVAVSIINDPSFFNFAKDAATSPDKNHPVSTQTVGTILQYLIAFIMINAPMLAAIKIGGEGSKLAVEWGEKAKKMGQGFIGQHTVGRAAKTISDSSAFADFARRNPNLAAMVDKNVLQKGAGAAFGGEKGTSYNKRLKDLSDAQVKMADKAGFNRPTSTIGRFFNGRVNAPFSAAGYEAEASTYKNETDVLEQRLNARKQIISNIESGKSGMSEGGKKKIVEETAKLQKEVEYRKKVLSSEGGLAKEVAARNTESGFNPVTKTARKDAAKKIRKSITKDKTEKLLEQLAKELKPEDKPKDDGPKPEKGGGDKK
jgi:uncharacterized membrane protein